MAVVIANNAQRWPEQRGYARRLLASDHREIARRQAREARIYDGDGRRRRRPEAIVNVAGGAL